MPRRRPIRDPKRPFREPPKVCTMVVPDIPVWIRDLPVMRTPFVFTAPAISNAAAVVVAGHPESVFSDRARNYNIVDLPGGAVIQDIVCAPGRSDAFESTRHADGVVVVANEQARADCCKEQNEKNLFHVAQRINRQTAICLSG